MLSSTNSKEVYLTNIKSVKNKFILTLESIVDLTESKIIFNKKEKTAEFNLTKKNSNQYECEILVDLIKGNGVWTIQIQLDSNSKPKPIYIVDYLKKQIYNFECKLLNSFRMIELLHKDDKLYLKSSEIMKDGKINILPNYVSDALFNNKSLHIKGYLDTTLVESNKVKLVMKLRKSDEVSLSYNMQFDDQGNWESQIDVSDFALGTWDFYLDYDEKLYRLNVQKDNFSAQLTHLLNEHSLLIRPYMTVKGSFSVEVEKDIIKFHDLTIKELSDKKMFVEGKIYLQHDNLLDEKYIIFNSRASETSIKHNIHIYKKEDYYIVNFTINYDDFIKYEDENNKWDAFFSLNKQLMRIRIKSETVKNDSIVLLDNKPLQIALYQTVKDNLSLSIEKVKVTRDLHEIKVDNKGLSLSGTAMLVDFDSLHGLKREVVIRQRYLEREKSFPIKSNGKEFSLSIEWGEILELANVNKIILDIYIRFKNEHYYIEKKLGKEVFEFLKDDILGKGVFKNNNNYHYFYLSITPFGNIKLDHFVFSTKQHIYLKYLQDLDRFFNKKRDVWLMGERQDTAQDTGYHFFKYCRENHPDKEVYYVIESNSKDINNIKHLGNVIELGSMEHLRLTAIAKKFIGSHDIEHFMPAKAEEFSSYINGERVFLQHGVLGRKKVEYYKKDYKYPFDLFCVSSEAEKDLVINEMGFDEEDVAVTGLTRFDALLDSHGATDSILLIPTWRPWLTNNQTFASSKYFRAYDDLLNDVRLHKLLNDNNITLNFYVHYRMQPYLKNFSTNHDKIKIISFGEINVQDLLKSNRLMITDYSSVSFDFNYLDRPIIFYHFDFNRFFKDGILRSPDETFIGDIVNEHDELIYKIEHYVNNDFKSDNIYNIEMDKIFKYKDQNNCKRVFEAINKL